MPVAVSLSAIVRHVPAPLAVGLTQPSTVRPVVRCRDALSGTVTQRPVPVNASAPPNLPVVVRVAPVIVPVLPLPERSDTVAPLVSSNAQAPTRPLAGVVTLNGTATVFGEPDAPGAAIVTVPV